jgi:hypothetical protein
MTNSDALPHPLEPMRDIEHFAYFPTSQARADFIYRCLKAGFRLRNTSEPPEPGAGFGAIVFHTNADLEQASSTLTGFAAEYGGRYDGWKKHD